MSIPRATAIGVEPSQNRPQQPSRLLRMLLAPWSNQKRPKANSRAATQNQIPDGAPQLLMQVSHQVQSPGSSTSDSPIRSPPPQPAIAGTRHQGGTPISDQARTYVSAKDFTRGFSQVVNDFDLTWQNIRGLEEQLARMLQGPKSLRSQSINAFSHKSCNIKGLSAFFDGGADVNTVQEGVLDRLGILWNRKEDLPAKQQERMGVAQFDGGPVEILGEACIRWYFPQVDGVPFTIPVKVVPSTEDAQNPEILIGDCFLRPLRTAIERAKVELGRGPDAQNLIMRLIQKVKASSR